MVSLCALDIKKRVCFPAGLLDRVQRTLAEKGYTVVVRDLRSTDDCMKLSPDVVCLFSPVERDLLDAVALHPLGRIEVANDAALKSCAVVIDGFPKVGVTVAVPTRSDAFRAWRHFSERLSEEVGLVTSGGHRNAPRVLVGTPASLTPNTVRRPDVLLLPFGDRSTGQRFIDAVVGTGFRRIYAFVRQTEHRDGLTQLRLEQLGGPVIVRCRPTRKRVRVAVFDVPDVGVPLHLMTERDRKHAWYWTNSVRNKAIATVAQGLLRGDAKFVQKLGLKTGKNVVRKVAILVECPVHGRELVKLLPDWSLLTTHTAEQESTGGVIVTEAHAATNTFSVDVLVRATGTGWPLSVKDFPPAQLTKDSSEVLVVDFRDDFSSDTARMARQRENEYRRRDMDVVELGKPT